jgi:hypothetical protein
MKKALCNFQFTRFAGCFRKAIFNFQFICYLLFVPTIVFASAPQISVQISPLILEYSLNLGQSQEGAVAFYNPLDTSQIISPQIWDFAPSDEIGGLRIFHDSSSQFSASKWISFDSSPFKLEPKTEKLLPFTITVPKKAEPGSHYAAIFGEAQAWPTSETDSKDVGLTPGVRVKVHVGAGTLFLIDIPEIFLGEKASYSGSVVSFELQGFKQHKLIQILNRLTKVPVGLVGEDPLVFIVRFQNTGIFHQKPKGVIEIFNVLGKRVATLSISSQRVLPGAIIQFKTQWRPRFLMGPYHAKLNFFYGKESQQKIESEEVFLALSPRSLGLLGAGIFVILGIVVFQKRRRT